MTRSIALALSLLAACTTLGPTPATTGFSAVPAARPNIEAQVGVMPGHYLSSAVVEKPKGALIGQLGLSIEPDGVVNARGLVFGARLFGQDGDTPIEPMVGYRQRARDGRLAWGGVIHGTKASAERDDASYEASRFGIEAVGDLRLTAKHRWAELHAFGGAALTRISVDGTYCVDSDGTYGVQCPEMGGGTMRTGHAEGVYPAGHIGLSGELFRHRPGWFHGVRLAAMAAVGSMPRVIGNEQTDAKAYFSIGFAGSVAIGGE